MSQTASGEISMGQDDAMLASRPNQSPPRELEQVYAPIQSDLQIVERLLRNQLTSETPVVDQLLEHSWMLGGKRLRPVLLLLSGACAGDIADSHHQLAVALEMIHTATLVHDDVLDNAATRRHQPTTNAVWGQKQSILLGDYLFTHAFGVASRSGSSTALQMLALASNRVCEGEMKQNAWQGQFDLDESSYLQMITEKTAELCGVACQLGAYLSGANSEVANQYGAYGRNLGVAFQIIDDVLDIVGQASEVGKTLGTDLINQKATLPVIHCLRSLPPEQQRRFREFLGSDKPEMEPLKAFLTQTNSLSYARQCAQQHAQNALEFASSIAPGPAANALQQLAEFVLVRSH